MAMVVQHNLQAANANRMLGVTTGAQAKSTEKLSSGFRINRAADDAAGLTISEKMRKQIKGLTQASTNAQDGVSAVQTAEGALTEVHSMLQRMNELATQAANGTNSQNDREAIQAEIDQLTTEIDRVSETTKFNDTYLLKGNDSKKTINMKAHDAGLSGKLTDNGDGTATFKMDELKAGDKITIAGKEYTISASDDDIDAAFTDANITDDAGSPTVTINGKEYKYYAEITASGGNKGTDAGWYSSDPAGLNNSTSKVNAEKADVAELKTAAKASGATTTIGTVTLKKATDANNDGVDDNDSSIITAKKAYMLAQDELLKANQIGDTKGSAKVGTKADPAIAMTLADAKNEFGIKVGQASVADKLSFSLHVGADADMTNKINVDIESMSSAGLGIKGINLSDENGAAATYAIDAIKDAISKVSSQRSQLGAIQNRLEHTIANVDNVVENTTSAESRIRDTDMATEMVNYSKNNILAQAGQSMLAQANQSNQGVLSLLG